MAVSSPAIPLVSLVTPAHNEEASLPVLVQGITAVLAAVPHEILIVDDGSADGTWAVITRLAEQYPTVRGLRLTRNFGHQAAILAGLSAATGEAVITLDSDGQHPPELIPALIARWRQGSRVVQAVRTTTDGESVFKRWTSKAFYDLLRRLGGPQIPQGSADFRLLSRPVVQTVLDSVGPLLFMRGLVPWLGYPTDYVPFEAPRRHGGAPSFTLRRMLSFSLSGLMSFTIVPLRLSIFGGFAVAALSLVYLIVTLVAYFTGHVVQGWASVMGLLSLLGGIQLVTIGLLGEYVGRLFIGGLNRPHFVVLEQTGPPGHG